MSVNNRGKAPWKHKKNDTTPPHPLIMLWCCSLAFHQPNWCPPPSPHYWTYATQPSNETNRWDSTALIADTRATSSLLSKFVIIYGRVNKQIKPTVDVVPSLFVQGIQQSLYNIHEQVLCSNFQVWHTKFYDLRMFISPWVSFYVLNV